MEEVNVSLGTLEEENKPIIKVIGVGGGGGNAVNHMFDKGICDVDFVVCNTDKMALEKSPVPIKVQLGEKGLGAGNKPANGAQAAIETLPQIQEILSDSTEMVFITAGMGGGTGTGAAPIIAQAAKDLGILTIGIVTIPFLFEGKRRVQQALKGVEEMRKHVDAILVVNTERINGLYSDLSLDSAFGKADDVLTIAAKGIAELITVPGKVNVDLEDVKTVMTMSGDAVMGSACCSGDHRGADAIKAALNSPLLQRTNLEGAKYILLNIAYSSEYPLMVNELQDITNFIGEQIEQDETETIWGTTVDDTLSDGVNVTIVATGFNLTNEERYGAQTAKYMTPAPAAQPKVVEREPEIDVAQYYENPQTQPVRKAQQPVAAPAPEPAVSVAVEQKPTPTRVTLSLDDTEEATSNIELQPAYIRRKSTVKSPYDCGEVSKFTLSSDGSSTEISDKNSYLHDNVD